MENIFAKAPVGQSHHYTLLLKRKLIKSTEEETCFAKSIGSRDHLYTPKGVNKGHRRALSVQQDMIQTPTVSSSPVLFISDFRPKLLSESTPKPIRLEDQLEKLQRANYELDLNKKNLEYEVMRLKKLLDIERKVRYI